VAATNGARMTVHPGRARKWLDVDEDIYAEYMWIRSSGVGVASEILFGLIERRKPSFAGLPNHARWSWFTSFTRRHNLCMRKPSRCTDDHPNEDALRAQTFIAEVKAKIVELQASFDV
jgi:hypothetical protein